MTSFARLIEKDIFADLGPAESGDSAILDLFGWQGGASRISCQAIYDVVAPTPQDFASPHLASLVNQSLTYTSVDPGTASNSITITIVDPGTPNHALTIGTVGTAITVTLATDAGSVITSTGNAVKAAINADVTANLLVLVTGTNASTLAALSTTPLAGGADGAIDTTLNTITITDHGFVTALIVQLTSTGTLPSPLTTATDYYVIVVDDNTIQLATSESNALAGIEINLTTKGSNNAVGTITATALAGGSVAFYGSNDPTLTSWTLLEAATIISSDGSYLFKDTAVSYHYFKAIKSLTSGEFDLKGYVLVVGQNI